MKTLTGPITSLHYVRHSSVLIETAQSLIHFPRLTMQVKSTASEMSAKPQVVFIYDKITIPQFTTKSIIAFVDYSSERNATGTVTPLGKFTGAVSLLTSYSISTMFDRTISVGITNTTESHFNISIKKNTKTARIFVVTPEQFKFIKPVDTVILTMILEGDPDLTTYLKELLRTNKPEQQKYTSWFATTADSEKNADHTRIQTRIDKELHDLEEKEKLNITDKTE